MSKIKDSLERTKAIIGADKATMPEECKALALRDITGTLSEYFNLCGKVALDVTIQNGQYVIAISCKADRIKSFTILK